VSTRIIETPDDMHALGLELARDLRAGDVLVLTGPLGAGKTTLTRGIGEGLRVRGPVTSPTFVLARTHPSLVGGPPLVHVDAYRLSNAMELDDLDIDFAHSITIVEWGRGIVEKLIDEWLDVEIERPQGAGAAGTTEETAGEKDAEDDLTVEPRTVTITGHGARWSS
jgi:tRNA threonylcarbamoyl adenosine modification protein YjeE